MHHFSAFILYEYADPIHLNEEIQIIQNWNSLKID